MVPRLRRKEAEVVIKILPGKKGSVAESGKDRFEDAWEEGDADARGG